MARRLISSGSTFEADMGYSRAVVDGEWVFVSGTTGFDYPTMPLAEGGVAQAVLVPGRVLQRRASRARARATARPGVRVRRVRRGRRRRARGARLATHRGGSKHAQEPPRYDRHRLPGRRAGPGGRVLVARARL